MDVAAGMLTLVKASQPKNASLPMDVAAGMLTLVKASQPVFTTDYYSIFYR